MTSEQTRAQIAVAAAAQRTGEPMTSDDTRGCARCLRTAAALRADSVELQSNVSTFWSPPGIAEQRTPALCADCIEDIRIFANTRILRTSRALKTGDVAVTRELFDVSISPAKRRTVPIGTMCRVLDTRSPIGAASHVLVLMAGFEGVYAVECAKLHRMPQL